MPFILKAGKALNERKAEIRIQFKPPAADMNTDLDSLRNELVVRLQPDEAVYMKMVSEDWASPIQGHDVHGALFSLQNLQYGYCWPDVQTSFPQYKHISFATVCNCLQRQHHKGDLQQPGKAVVQVWTVPREASQLSQSVM